jgi:hypothetical protein
MRRVLREALETMEDPFDIPEPFELRSAVGS